MFSSLYFILKTKLKSKARHQQPVQIKCQQQNYGGQKIDLRILQKLFFSLSLPLKLLTSNRKPSPKYQALAVTTLTAPNIPSFGLLDEDLAVRSVFLRCVWNPLHTLPIPAHAAAHTQWCQIFPFALTSGGPPDLNWTLVSGDEEFALKHTRELHWHSEVDAHFQNSRWFYRTRLWTCACLPWKSPLESLTSATMAAAGDSTVTKGLLNLLKINDWSPANGF